MRHRERYNITQCPIECGKLHVIDQGAIYMTYPQVAYDHYATTGYKHSEETCDDELHPGPPYLSGGPFHVWKYTTDKLTVKRNVKWDRFLYRYEGGFLPSIDPDSGLQVTLGSTFESDVAAMGPEGWNKFRPTRPRVNLAVSTVELRELPRMLRTTAKGFADLWRSLGGSRTGFGPKSVADHWLNHQFGWLPFLSDVRAFYNTCKTIDRHLRQKRRDNGQWVKRSGQLLKSDNSELMYSQTNAPGHWPALTTAFYNSPYGSYYIKSSVKKTIWFSGRFRYYLERTDSWRDDARWVAMLFGIRPSPSVVWELTPWSWLIDWCSNVGDNIDNMTSIMFDNLCAKYAYVMGTLESRSEAFCSTNFKDAVLNDVWTSSLTWKHRFAASPFGFDLAVGDFSLRQLSILTALGISRLWS